MRRSTAPRSRCRPRRSAAALNIDVYEVQESWSEGAKDGAADAANWTERATGTAWTTAGGTFDPTAVASINTNAVGQHSWDVTSLVQGWVAGSKANNGFMIGSPDGGGNRTVTYDSRETVGGTAPVLVIDYTVANANTARRSTQRRRRCSTLSTRIPARLPARSEPWSRTWSTSPRRPGRSTTSSIRTPARSSALR
jgi:hypothetical protein